MTNVDPIFLISASMAFPLFSVRGLNILDNPQENKDNPIANAAIIIMLKIL